ncbi:hypothetical protein EBF04_05370 [Streptomyces sp. I6]|nr:hypothetical protein EBF04_05370 [Streptomyces sp. I6]
MARHPSRPGGRLTGPGEPGEPGEPGKPGQPAEPGTLREPGNGVTDATRPSSIGSSPIGSSSGTLFSGI